MILSAATEQIGHIELLATAVSMNLEGAKSEQVDEIGERPLGAPEPLLGNAGSGRLVRPRGPTRFVGEYAANAEDMALGADERRPAARLDASRRPRRATPRLLER